MHLIDHFILKCFEINLYLLVPDLIQPQVILHLVEPVAAIAILGGLLPVNELDNLVDASEKIK